MRLRHSAKYLVGVIGVAVLATGCANTAYKEDEEENEVKMSLDQVPPAAREALVREAKGASLTTVDREESKGRAIYEADAMIAGKNWEIKVDESGNLVSKKLDPESHK